MDKKQWWDTLKVYWTEIRDMMHYALNLKSMVDDEGVLVELGLVVNTLKDAKDPEIIVYLEATYDKLSGEDYATIMAGWSELEELVSNIDLLFKDDPKRVYKGRGNKIEGIKPNEAAKRYVEE